METKRVHTVSRTHQWQASPRVSNVNVQPLFFSFLFYFYQADLIESIWAESVVPVRSYRCSHRPKPLVDWQKMNDFDNELACLESFVIDFSFSDMWLCIFSLSHMTAHWTSDGRIKTTRNFMTLCKENDWSTIWENQQINGSTDPTKSLDPLFM